MDWTVARAASNLKVSEKTIRRWVSGQRVEFERRPGKYGDEVHIISIPDELMSRQPIPGRAQRAEMAVQTFADILSTKDRRIEELSRELGASRVMLHQLQEQVKLLESPQSSPRVQWWRRLFNRK